MELIKILTGWKQFIFQSQLVLASRSEEAFLLDDAAFYPKGAVDDLGVSVGDVKLSGGSKAGVGMLCDQDDQFDAV